MTGMAQLARSLLIGDARSRLEAMALPAAEDLPVEESNSWFGVDAEQFEEEVRRRAAPTDKRTPTGQQCESKFGAVAAAAAVHAQIKEADLAPREDDQEGTTPLSARLWMSVLTELAGTLALSVELAHDLLSEAGGRLQAHTPCVLTHAHPHRTANPQLEVRVRIQLRTALIPLSRVPL